MIEYRFTLIHNGVSTVLDLDPNGITGLKSSLKRDFSNHGVFFQFTEGDLSLEFAGEGRDVFKTARDLEGIDAEITFVFDQRDDAYSPYENKYTGTAIMENLEIDQDYAKVDFRESNVMTDIHNNLDTKVNFDSTEDIFGNAVTPLTPIEVTLAGRVLKRLSVGNMPIEQTPYTPSTVWSAGKDGTAATTLTMSTNLIVATDTNQIDNEGGIKGFNNDNEPPANFLVNPDATLGGQLTFYPKKVEYDITVGLSFILNAATSGTQPSGVINFILDKIEDEGQDSETITSTTLRAYNPSSEGSITEDANALAQSHTIGSKITKFRFRVNDGTGAYGAGNGVTVYFTSFILSGTITSVTYPSSSANMHYIYDALNKNIEYITGQQNLLQSNFFGTGGAGEYFAETNGYKLRASDYPIIESLKTRLDGLKAIFGIGYSLEVNSGYELVNIRVEPLEYFYADEELLSFTEIEASTYGETFYDPLGFNKIKIGYRTYSEKDEPSSLNDIFTEAEYNTPVSNLEDTYTQVSGYIASDILSEITRRVQFEDPDKSNKTDDDLFIFDLVDNYPVISPRDDTNVGVTNVDNSDSGYNFRINPRFNLWNHASIINSAVFNKSFSENYTNQFFKASNSQNRKVYYQTSATSLMRVIGDPTTGAGNNPTFDESFNVGRFNGGLRLFDPIKITFKTGLTQEQADTIVKAHRNQLDSLNYGYITVLDPDGESKSGWLLNLSYNPIDKIGSFELIKRADNYNS